jgi:integrase
VDFPANLRLPFWDREEAKAKRSAYSVETVRKIMEASGYPYNLLWWVAFECGIRRGEVCGLDVGHISLNIRTITVRRNRVGSVLKNTKSRRARVFRISHELAEQLKPLVEGRAADEPLFLSAEKCDCIQKIL